MTIRNLLREPLLHFLLIGLGLFLLYGQVSPGDAGRRIVVTQPQVDAMVRQYAALWGGPPGKQQLAGMIETYVRDEILYRDGMDAGLGRDDPVIKRRIRQKVEVMAEEENDRAAPTDADLAAYLKAHPDKFAQPAVVSFQQVYFNPQGPDTPATVAAAKARLAAGADPARFGQPSLLPGRIARTDSDTVARDFGADFATAITKLPIGQWSGPIGSGIGVHLVRLTALQPAAVAALADVRPAVSREWENDRRKAALAASYARLRKDYDVIIEAKLPQ